MCKELYFGCLQQCSSSWTVEIWNTPPIELCMYSIPCTYIIFKIVLLTQFTPSCLLGEKQWGFFNRKSWKKLLQEHLFGGDCWTSSALKKMHCVSWILRIERERLESTNCAFTEQQIEKRVFSFKKYYYIFNEYV